MTDKTPVSKKGFSADWFMQGALTKIGDTFDRLTGRKWIPSSSLATSELIEKMKNLLDAEAKDIPGKGIVVPHNIKLKMQWDKFSTDADDALTKLENELLTAAADHINDLLYYTYAPLTIEVKQDYFTEGVKLFVSFEKFSDDERVAETNVTIPAINIKNRVPVVVEPEAAAIEIFIARFELNDSRRDKRLEFPAGCRLSVGRTSGNDLAIDDMSVSKIHASLVASAAGQLSVADTGSTNGTFVNDQRISYGKAIRLVEGDVVKFGVVEVLFDHVPHPAEAEAGIPVAEILDQKTTEIDGFEFSSRESSEPAEQPKPLPDETLKIETLKTAAHKNETETEPGK